MERLKHISIYAQGSIEEFRYDGDLYDGQYLPARSLAYLPKDPTGLFVLPDHPDVTLYHRQLSAMHDKLGIIPPSVNKPIIVPDIDYLLDECIGQSIEILEGALDKNQVYKVFPYATTQLTLDWMNKLQERGFNVSSALPQKTYYEDLRSPAHRAGWARTVGKPNELSFPERYGIPYPKAFVGTGLKEIIEAYRLVCARSGNSDAFFKPVFSAGGFTLARITNENELIAHFNTLKKQGALEMLGRETPVEIQDEIKNMVGLYSLQYEDEKIVSPNILTRQIVKGTNWIGNIFNGDINPQLLMQAQEIFSRFVHGVREYTGKRLQGSGGIDLGEINKEGRQHLRVIEHNGQRITGGHPAIALAEGLGVISPFMTQKSPGDPNCDLATLDEVLRASHLGYDNQKKRGVFPIIWMKGSGMLWVAGYSEKDMRELLDKTYNQLMQKNLIT